jgi:hypothetical protein
MIFARSSGGDVQGIVDRHRRHAAGIIRLIQEADHHRRAALQRREGHEHHAPGRHRAGQQLRIDVLRRLLVRPAPIDALALELGPALLIGLEPGNRDAARLVAHLNRVVGIRDAPRQRRLVRKQVLRDHAGAEQVVDARLAAELLLLHVAHHQRRLAGDPALRRPVPPPPLPPRRIFPRQVAGRLERAGVRLAVLVARDQQPLALRPPQRQKFRLPRIRPEIEKLLEGLAIVECFKAGLNFLQEGDAGRALDIRRIVKLAPLSHPRPRRTPHPPPASPPARPATPPPEHPTDPPKPRSASGCPCCSRPGPSG